MTIYAEIRSDLIVWVSKSKKVWQEHQKLGGNAKPYVLAEQSRNRIAELEAQIKVWKTTPIGRLEKLENENERLRAALKKGERAMIEMECSCLPHADKIEGAMCSRCNALKETLSLLQEIEKV